MTTHTHLRITLLASASLALCLSHSHAHAAGPNVDAGALLRQAEQEIKPTKSAKKRTPRKATPTAPAQATEATVQVNAFAFKGNTLLGSDALQTALVSFTNRALTLAQLKEAADAITNTYREAGWTVRAFVPKQEIDNGVVTLQIVEAVFGGASVQTTPIERIDASRLVNMAETVLSKGQPIHASDIDRALLLLDDLPGVSVSGNLTEGQRDGETDLAIFAADDALINGNASVDNQGSRATGTDRLSVNLSLNSPLRLGDALTINALQTQGSEYQRFGYTVPVGYTGWRAGLHSSRLNYRVITREFDTGNPETTPHGTATTQGWDASYALVRSQMNNVNLALSFDNKKFDNIFATSATSYGIRVYNATLSANQTDQWNGGGITNSSITLTSGDKSTDGQYHKFNLNLSRLQSLTETLSLYVAASAQTASTNLDSSERIYLGGATGVRAYPSSEGGGSEGNTLTLELRQRLPNNISLIGFYDYGHVKVNRDNNIAPVANPNLYNLQGYGLTVAWQATQTMDFKATVAQRVGDNPAADNKGLDRDGTKKITRIWLSSSIAF